MLFYPTVTFRAPYTSSGDSQIENSVVNVDPKVGGGGGGGVEEYNVATSRFYV